MSPTVEVKEQIRQVLQHVASSESYTVDEALTRIMDVIDPVQQLAREELERYRSTFAELAK